VLVITHYQRILNYIKPDFVHIMMNGQIVETAAPNWLCTWKNTGTIGCGEKSEALA